MDYRRTNDVKKNGKFLSNSLLFFLFLLILHSLFLFPFSTLLIFSHSLSYLTNFSLNTRTCHPPIGLFWWMEGVRIFDKCPLPHKIKSRKLDREGSNHKNLIVKVRIMKT